MEKVLKSLEGNYSKDSLKKLKEFIANDEMKKDGIENPSSTAENKEESKKYNDLYYNLRQKYSLNRADLDAEIYINNQTEIAEYNRWALKLSQKWLLSFYHDQFWTQIGISLLKYKYILNQEVINLQVCKDFIEGYYLPKDHKIVICANNLTNYEKNYRFNRAIKRHLILLYDHMRSENYDFNNCQHLACSEVRAAKLSGYCRHSYSYYNGFYAPEKNESLSKTCVKTKAVDHINTYYDHCSKDSKKYVDFVMEKCYHDNVPIYDFSKEKNFIHKF